MIQTTANRLSLVVSLAAVMLCSTHMTNALAFEVTDIRFEDPDDNHTLTDADLNEYFNLARCLCETSTRVVIEITTDRTNTDDLLVVTGLNCFDENTDDIVDDDRCQIVYGPQNIDQLTGKIELSLTGAELMPGDCEQENELRLSVWTGEPGAYTEVASREYYADGEPPPAPTAGDAPVAGEKLITVNFSKGTDLELTDVSYQLLCAKVTTDSSGNVSLEPWAGTTASKECHFQSVSGTCGETVTTSNSDTTDGGIAADAGTSSDTSVEASAADSDASSDLATTLLSDPAYVCSAPIAGAGDATITGLENGATYRVWAVAYDKSGNVSEPIFLGSATPTYTESLWERYKRSGGASTGGYCNIVGTNGYGALWLALALTFCLLISRRRNRASWHRHSIWHKGRNR